MGALSVWEWVVFALRIGIGLLLIAAGALKVGHADVLASTIAATHFLPTPIIAPFALVLPFFEIGLGGYLVAGLFTRTAALIAAVQFAIFAVVIASLVIRNIPISCGCFGPQDSAPASWMEVVRDLALAVLALVIVVRAPGRLAVDNRIGGS